jgi:hypothetical protein
MAVIVPLAFPDKMAAEAAAAVVMSKSKCKCPNACYY